MLPFSHFALTIGALKLFGHSVSSAFTNPLPEA
jgi:hypothetical protein